MRIRLDSARFEPLRWHESVAPDPSQVGYSGVVAISPIAVSGSLSYLGPGYLLEAELRFQIEVACDRCLERAELEIVSRIGVLVEQRRSAREERGERELEVQDLETVEVSGDDLETGPLVGEQVLLELPRKPLCRESCRGLCPSCGANRNLGECGCDSRSIDPRWGALAELKSRIGGHG